MELYQAAIVFAVAFVTTFACVPLARKIGEITGAIDHPASRRINKVPVPRCGGIALYLGLCAAALTTVIGTSFFQWEINNLYIIEGVNYPLVFIGITVMFTLGLVDDITQLKAWPKLLVQTIAAAIIAAGGITAGSLQLIGDSVYINLGWVDYPFTVIFLVAFANIINLIDGLDGLASGITIISATALLYLMILRGGFSLAFVCIALIAVSLAFLRYNFFPASIFMGDCGALLLGLMLGIVSLTGIVRTQSFIIMLVPIILAGVPVLDTLSSIIRRTRAHESIGHADTEHIHHRLLRAGLSQKRTVALLWACTALLALIGCLISAFNEPMQIGILVILAIVVFIVIWQFGLFKPVLRHHYDNIGKEGPRIITKVRSTGHDTEEHND